MEKRITARKRGKFGFQKYPRRIFLHKAVLDTKLYAYLLIANTGHHTLSQGLKPPFIKIPTSVSSLKLSVDR